MLGYEHYNNSERDINEALTLIKVCAGLC